MVVSGALLFYANPPPRYQNIFFRAKMVLLVLAAINAWVFHARVCRSIAEWDGDPVPPRTSQDGGRCGSRGVGRDDHVGTHDRLRLVRLRQAAAAGNRQRARGLRDQLSLAAAHVPVAFFRVVRAGPVDCRDAGVAVALPGHRKPAPHGVGPARRGRRDGRSAPPGAGTTESACGAAGSGCREVAAGQSLGDVAHRLAALHGVGRQVLLPDGFLAEDDVAASGARVYVWSPAQGDAWPPNGP